MIKIYFSYIWKLLCIKSCCKNSAKAFLQCSLLAEQTDKEFIGPLNSGSKVLGVGPP